MESVDKQAQGAGCLSATPVEESHSGSVLQDHALAVGGRDAVLAFLHDANHQVASVDRHVADVDEVGPLDRALDEVAGQDSLEEEDDRDVGLDQEDGDLVSVAVLDVAGDALADCRQHGVGADLDVHVTTEGVDAPPAIREADSLVVEERHCVPLDSVVESAELAGRHGNLPILSCATCR